jgi:hypothetical protein
VNVTGWSRGLEVTAGGAGIVSHAGLALSGRPRTVRATQQILIGRGDDHAQRAYVNSDYTLAGRMTCHHCGKHYVGTSATGPPPARHRPATGHVYRYRYYTCFTRQRYGPDSCPAEY